VRPRCPIQRPDHLWPAPLSELAATSDIVDGEWNFLPPTERITMRSIQLFLAFGSLISAASFALAQTAAPTTGSAASSSGNMGWLWIILLLVLAGGAIWYFGFGRNKATGTSSTTTGSSSMEIDRDRVAGSGLQAKGSLKEGAGTVLGDSKLEAEGKLDKVEGQIQNTVGGIKDTLRGR
jgi:uncharacterized protein YjbJ (UPF0337 family)